MTLTNQLAQQTLRDGLTHIVNNNLYTQ